MVLSEDKAAQFRPEMAGDAGWQWRCHDLAARCQPTLTVEIHDVRVDHQVLHHKVRVTFEARALRGSHKRDGPLLMNRQLRCLAVLLARLASSRRWLRLSCPFHPAGFDIRPA